MPSGAKAFPYPVCSSRNRSRSNSPLLLSRHVPDGDAKVEGPEAVAMQVRKWRFHGQSWTTSWTTSLESKNPQKPMLMRVSRDLVALHGFEPRTCGL